jgi:4-diphosphocytidyl-2C-methyl-D-erythritol kinase
MLSGSGSCCVARVASEAQDEKVSKIIRDAWGDAVFVVETSVAQIESKAR